MNILVVGDSFAADWTVKYPNQKGWPNLLAENFSVTNLAQAGCSEYKIWLQLKKATLKKFTHIIIVHTSPYRIPVQQHPFHTGLHLSADLIYSDVKDNNQFPSIVDFFENYFNTEYAEFVHTLIIKEEAEYLNSFKGQILHIEWTKSVAPNVMSIEKYFKNNPGLINHLSDKGNQLVYNQIKGWINNDDKTFR